MALSATLWALALSTRTARSLRTAARPCLLRAAPAPRLALPLELPDGCKLLVGVEYCTAQRPSRNGSLRGSSEAYVMHFAGVQMLVHEVLCPGRSDDGAVIANNERVPSNARPQQ